MPGAVRIAVIWHGLRKPPANPELALRLPQQQASIGRLVAALKIRCEFLASNRWKVKGQQILTLARNPG
jgi:hypothetical protein